jgi:hypothetical protein
MGDPDEGRMKEDEHSPGVGENVRAGEITSGVVLLRGEVTDSSRSCIAGRTSGRGKEG